MKKIDHIVSDRFDDIHAKIGDYVDNNKKKEERKLIECERKEAIRLRDDERFLAP